MKIVCGKVLFILILFSLNCSLHGSGTDRELTNRIKGLPSVSVSAGAGVWHMPLQNGMENRFLPVSVSLEYGRASCPFSLFAGAFIFTAYNIDYFLLKPNYLMAGIQYAPLKGKRISEKFNIYATGGINLSYTRFTEELYPGITSYENKVERQLGAGLAAGIGAGYKLKYFEVRPMLFGFTGKARFFAGHFTKQAFNAGSLQCHLLIVHRFNLHKTACPAFRKYYKF
ncbi:MAG TPA: hypothetical protein VK155_09950 [Bacteroidales bacterium]|nr:hypothetical protein [Bacteroidales bacterium]